MARRSKAERERRQLEATAYHEAGHAVVAIHLGRSVAYATIEPEDDSLGHIQKTRPPSWFKPDCDPGGRAERWISREVTIGLAGIAAGHRFTGRSFFVQTPHLQPISASADSGLPARRCCIIIQHRSHGAEGPR